LPAAAALVPLAPVLVPLVPLPVGTETENADSRVVADCLAAGNAGDSVGSIAAGSCATGCRTARTTGTARG